MLAFDFEIIFTPLCHEDHLATTSGFACLEGALMRQSKCTGYVRADSAQQKCINAAVYAPIPDTRTKQLHCRRDPRISSRPDHRRSRHGLFSYSSAIFLLFLASATYNPPRTHPVLTSYPPSLIFHLPFRTACRILIALLDMHRLECLQPPRRRLSHPAHREPATAPKAGVQLFVYPGIFSSF